MKKEAILCTAARLFSERGFNNTPTMLLSKEAGVAEGTIFRHFKTKDEIFYILVQNVKNLLLEDLERNVAGNTEANGLEKVLSITRFFCIFVRKNRMEFSLLFRDAPSRYDEVHDRAYQAIRNIFDTLGQSYESALLAGQADGSVNPEIAVQDTADILTCTVVGLMRSLRFELIATEGENSSILKNLQMNLVNMLAPRG